ncbi:MAG: 30S ribosomal protein S16 [Bacteroidetes bacterium CG2_30_32_10]|nr:MAG: 30S ribosomal protein S16 [Bacteroidetes bacterium CG2_30_32_10]
MPTRIRLQRKGKKGNPFYHIVIADGRAPRDGKCIETIGTYNPLTAPATIVLDNDKAMQWLQSGASPSETVLAILKFKGIVYKYHLSKGVKKGALTQEQADTKFNAWLEEKETKIKSKLNLKSQEERQVEKKLMEAEVKANQKKSEAVAAKRAKEAEKLAEKNAPKEEPVVDATIEEKPAEEPSTEQSTEQA